MLVQRLALSCWTNGFCKWVPSRIFGVFREFSFSDVVGNTLRNCFKLSCVVFHLTQHKSKFDYSFKYFDEHFPHNIFWRIFTSRKLVKRKSWQKLTLSLIDVYVTIKAALSELKWSQITITQNPSIALTTQLSAQSIPVRCCWCRCWWSLKWRVSRIFEGSKGRIELMQGLQLISLHWGRGWMVIT